MDVRKLTKQLKREAKANPGKSGFLGLGVLLALWFWLPIVLPDSSDDQNPATKDESAGAQVNPAAPNPSVVAARSTGGGVNTAEDSKFPWNQVAQWIDEDRLMRSATLSEDVRNPFIQKKTTAGQPEAVDGQSATPVVVTPQTLGLKLTGTFIGPRRKLARINGRTYWLVEAGSSSSARKQGRLPHQLVIKHGESVHLLNLIAVQPRSVILEIGGKHYPLHISEASLSGSDYLEIHRKRPQSDDSAQADRNENDDPSTLTVWANWLNLAILRMLH